LTLCGAGKIHPIADSLGIINDALIFAGTGHLWAELGNFEPQFIQALDFTTDFLFPLLPCNVTAIDEVNASPRKLVKITDVLGRKASTTKNSPLFYIYDDGSVEKKIILN
ncbi:MAG: hypothetical protein HN535_03385, partial [Flavobacteriales bacterium]|nr:hypothetical protein [Flavobacteriales bacterium]